MIGLSWRTFWWVVVVALIWGAAVDSPKANSQVSKPDCELEILWAQDSALGVSPYDRRGRPDNTGKCAAEIRSAGV